MSATKGWSCTHCTYKHRFPSKRCAMCNELRITKQHMVDFVQGKPIPESSKINSATVSAVDPLKEAEHSKKKKTAATAKRKGAQGEKSPEKQPKRKRPITSQFFTRPKEATSTYNAPTTSSCAASTSKPNAASVTVRNPYASVTSKKNQKDSSMAASARNIHVAQQNTDNASNGNGNPNPNPNQNNNGSIEVQPISNSNSIAERQHTNPTINNNNSQINHTRQLPQNQQQIHNENWNPQRKPFQQKPSALYKNNYQKPSNSKQGNNNNNKQVPPNNSKVQKSNENNRLEVNRKPPVIKHYFPGPVPFDKSTISEWVYPKDPEFARREYQVNISETALFHNTLVSLPTGLGKTLIAAVVMYNYYRWFPTGKLIFCAPTLPLVEQQAQACFKMNGISEKDTAVLNGKVPRSEREKIWKERRVFFCTPQTVQNDFEHSVDIPSSQVVCLILDEAHKATGEYAYVKIVELLEKAQAKFRIVGLSATPGSSIDGIQRVVTALRIAKIECRQEEDSEIAKHTHCRATEVAIVEEPSLVTELKDRLVKKLIRPYLQKAQQQYGLLNNYQDAGKIHTMNILEAQERVRNCKDQYHPSACTYLAALNKLIQWRELLSTNGIGLFFAHLRQFKNGPKRGALSTMFQSEEFEELWKATEEATTNNGGGMDNKKLVEQNPKLLKLREIVHEHFARAKALDDEERKGGSRQPAILSSTRVIVFSQLRDSVSEIVSHLEASRPFIRAHRFVGQSKGSSSGTKDDEGIEQAEKVKGMNQKEQHRVIKEFRDGIHNVLVCTCIGEEGLDIGEVDLIINVDTLSSPIRMLQRVGRTGRKRDGRVVCLLTKNEEAKYKRAKANQKKLAVALKGSADFKVVPSAPMFPIEGPMPFMSDREGLTRKGDDYKFSQVAGHCGRKQKRRKSRKDGSSPKKRRDVAVDDADGGWWKLTGEEEQQRVRFLGEIAEPCGTGNDQSNFGFPLSVRKRMLKARNMAFAAQTPVDLSRYTLGSTVKLLRTFQELHGKRYDPSKIPVPKRASTRETKSTKFVFPFLEEASAATTTLRSFQETYVKVSLNSMPKCNPRDSRIEESCYAALEPKNRQSEPAANHSNRGAHVSASSSEGENSSTNTTYRSTKENAEMSARMAPSNPYKKIAGDVTKEQGPRTTNRDDPLSKNDSTVAPAVNLAPPPKRTAVDRETAATAFVVNPYAAPKKQQVARNLLADKQQTTSISPSTGTVFEKASINNISDVCQVQAVPGTSTYTSGAVANKSSLNEAVDKSAWLASRQHQQLDLNHEAAMVRPQKEDDTNDFCLPPPESSSSEDEDESDDGEGDDYADEGERLLHETQRTAARLQQNSLVTEGGVDMQEAGCSRASDEDSALQPVNIVIENMPSAKEDEREIFGHSNGGKEDRSIAQDSQSLRLPTQDSSSSSSDEESSACNSRNEVEGFAKTLHQDPTEFELPCHLSAKVKPNTASDQSPPNVTNTAITETNLHHQQEVEEVLHVGDDGEDEDMPLIALRRDNITPKEARSSEQGQVKQSIRSEEQSDREHADTCDTASQDTEVLFIKKKRHKQAVDPFLTQGDFADASNKTPSNTTAAVLMDTPPDVAAGTPEGHDGLIDTPAGNENGCSIDNIDTVVCAVCFSGDFCDDDPIIFCDGPGVEKRHTCNLAVHQTCYNVSPEQVEADLWRCDPCSQLYKAAVTKEISEHDFDCLSCCVCQRRDGPLQRISRELWSHPYCIRWSSANSANACSLCSLKGAVRCCAQQCNAAIHPHCALSSHTVGSPNSWTFLHINFPAVQERVKGADSMSIVFCPKDRKESQDFIQQHSRDVGNATERPKLQVIPPQQLLSANEPSSRKSQLGPVAGPRLKKLGRGAAAAIQKTSRPPVYPRKRQGWQKDKKAPSPTDVEKRQARKRARLERRKLAKGFFDEEADIRSDDDMYGDEGEERDLADLEADEISVNSFINDSSQLGYSQDELGRVDPSQANSATPASGGVNDDALHRRIDNERVRQNQFATPMLNRRMRCNSSTPANAPESEKGLGKMHFIRSVLEHHKNGGDADQIEEVYHELEQEKTQPEEDPESARNNLAAFSNPQYDDDDENPVQFDYGL